jgi:type IV secretory pathway VirB10-like protein
MMQVAQECLPRSPRTTIIQPRVKHVTILAVCLLAHGALAQQQSESKPKPAQGQDDLDVTMQIIVDPDAKLPDDVVRRIPLPERKPVESTKPNADKKADKAAAAEARDTAREAKDLAKQEAAEQREQARRARAEERERNHPPKNPPGRPPRD